MSSKLVQLGGVFLVQERAEVPHIEEVDYCPTSREVVAIST